jgi:hypothetical protein
VAKTKNGALILGTAVIYRGSGGVGEASDWIRPLPEKRGFCPLGPLKAANVWHRVQVHVLEDRITIHLDGEKRIQFDMDWLKKADPETRGIDPRGAVGVWTRDGKGWFKNATIMALPPEQPTRN